MGLVLGGTMMAQASCLGYHIGTSLPGTSPVGVNETLAPSKFLLAPTITSQDSGLKNPQLPV